MSKQTQNNDECNDLMSNICPLQGDYGDPLMCKTSRGFVQVGIMSSGNPDGCNSASLTIYTKVSGYMGYINARLNPVTKELAQASFSKKPKKNNLQPFPMSRVPASL